MNEETPEITVRSYERQIRSSISKDYVIYSLEHECDLRIDEDPILFTQVMESDNSENWINAIKEELK